MYFVFYLKLSSANIYIEINLRLGHRSLYNCAGLHFLTQKISTWQYITERFIQLSAMRDRKSKCVKKADT